MAGLNHRYFLWLNTKGTFNHRYFLWLNTEGTYLKVEVKEQRKNMKHHMKLAVVDHIKEVTRKEVTDNFDRHTVLEAMIELVDRESNTIISNGRI